MQTQLNKLPPDRKVNRAASVSCSAAGTTKNIYKRKIRRGTYQPDSGIGSRSFPRDSCVLQLRTEGEQIDKRRQSGVAPQDTRAREHLSFQAGGSFGSYTLEKYFGLLVIFCNIFFLTLGFF